MLYYLQDQFCVNELSFKKRNSMGFQILSIINRLLRASLQFFLILFSKIIGFKKLIWIYSFFCNFSTSSSNSIKWCILISVSFSRSNEMVLFIISLRCYIFSTRPVFWKYYISIVATHQTWQILWKFKKIILFISGSFFFEFLQTWIVFGK